jgi:hypothetical protein
MGTWRHGNMETWKHEVMESWRHRAMETWRSVDMKAWTQGDMETSNGNGNTVCSSCKRKFVVCPFAGEEKKLKLSV